MEEILASADEQYDDDLLAIDAAEWNENSIQADIEAGTMSANTHSMKVSRGFWGRVDVNRP